MYENEICVRQSDREILLNTKLFVIGTMEVPKSKTIAKLRRLEEELRYKCIENNLTEIGDFVFMFDNENGRNICFMKDMPIEWAQSMREFYDKNSPTFMRKYEDIEWPYTGFVQGNISGWNPISTERLAEWLENSISRYTFEDFSKGFQS